MLMLLTAVFVGLLAFFVYKFKRLVSQREVSGLLVIGRAPTNAFHLARRQENPLDPRPGRGDQREGARSDQHGRAR